MARGVGRCQGVCRCRLQPTRHRVRATGDYFVSYELSCDRTDRTGFSVPILAHATSVQGLVRSQLRGVLSSDIIEAAGYPPSGENDWRVVRDGDVVGSLRAWAAGGNGAIFSVFVCAESGIARP